MELNTIMVRELMDVYCDGNYNKFSRELNIDPSHLYRFLTQGIGGGKKLMGAVSDFCKTKELEIKDYIDF